jgi:hypothetical protein
LILTPEKQPRTPSERKRKRKATANDSTESSKYCSRGYVSPCTLPNLTVKLLQRGKEVLKVPFVISTLCDLLEKEYILHLMPSVSSGNGVLKK